MSSRKANVLLCGLAGFAACQIAKRIASPIELDGSVNSLIALGSAAGAAAAFDPKDPASIAVHGIAGMGLATLFEVTGLALFQTAERAQIETAPRRR